MTLSRGKGLTHDPARAAERRRRREARRAAEDPRPEDEAREERQGAPQASRSSVPPHDAEAARLWWRAVTAGGCVMCHDCPVDEQTRRERRADLEYVQGAHIVPQDKLKRWGMHDRLWDIRNGLGLCRFHHARHDYAVQRCPRRLLPVEAFEFADEINARWVLEDDTVWPLDP
jgi:hypothetical protein